MGIYLHLSAADLFIPERKASQALERARKWNHDFEVVSSDVMSSLKEVFAWFAWPMVKTTMGYRLDRRSLGVSSKFGWQNELLEAIAPTVAAGSYLLATRDDGEPPLTWLFDGAGLADPAEEIEVGAVTFNIPKTKRKRALAAARTMLEFVPSVEVCKSLDTVFRRQGWETDRGDEGELVVQGKEEDTTVELDDWLFTAVAPFVTPGSTIEAAGQRCWTWTFDGKRCRRVYDA